MDTESRKRSSYNAVITAEYRLLNSLVKRPEFRADSRITESILVDEVAKSVLEAILSLDERHLQITPASLLQAGQEIDYNITKSVITEVFEIDANGADSLDDILKTLKTAQVKNKLLEKLSEVEKEINEPGEINSSKIQEELYRIDTTLATASRDDSKLLNFDTWATRYKEDLQQRKLGRKYSFGDILLDQVVFRGAMPGSITIIAARTSMGKSTYVLSLMDGLLERGTPCMYLSLEMGTIDTMDRLISKRCGIDNSDLYKAENIDGIIERVEEEQETLKSQDKFYFCEATNVDMSKLRTLIREFKQKAHSDYGMVAIDLLSSMKSFMVGNNGASTAAMIENNMNALEALAKEENVHIIGVVQIRQDTDAMAGKIRSIEDINLLRPSLGDVKNSSAYSEKACLLLSVFRPKFYATRYLSERDPGVAEMTDIMEVQILKDRNSEGGQILKYIFDGKRFSVSPLPDEELEKMEKLKNLAIDY